MQTKMKLIHIALEDSQYERLRRYAFEKNEKITQIIREEIKNLLRINDRQTYLAAANLKGTHTATQWSRLAKKYKGYCVRCLKISSKIEKDHIVPIYQGGSNSIDNLQPICKRCNCQKGPENINWLEKNKEKLEKIIKKEPLDSPTTEDVV